MRLRGIERRYDVTHGTFGRKVGQVRAVDGIDLDVFPGEALGLVGESGSGKSTLGRVLLRLEEPDGGTIEFDGRDITHLSMRELRPLRADLQLIFQDPYSSLDPRTSVGESIMEGLHAQGVPRRERETRLREVLDLVGLPAYHARRFPHEFSGGQRQRIGIARALAVKPRFLVLDEPVSALDVSIQSQILNLLRDLQGELDLTMLFVAHDLSVVEHLCERIAVMYLGRIVEIATRDELFGNPTHPYTQALLSAVPVPDPHRARERVVLQGDPPSPLDPPSGCRFHTRCPIAAAGRCDVDVPELRSVAGSATHQAACLLRT